MTIIINDTDKGDRIIIVLNKSATKSVHKRHKLEHSLKINNNGTDKKQHPSSSTTVKQQSDIVKQDNKPPSHIGNTVCLQHPISQHMGQNISIHL